jgi:hypothetical protein
LHRPHEAFGGRKIVPLDESERIERLRLIKAALPEDYLDLTRHTEGLVAPGCTILGLAEIYEHTETDSDYYLIAQVGDLGMLAVRKGESGGKVTFLRYDESDKRQYPDLRTAIRDLLSGWRELGGPPSRPG